MEINKNFAKGLVYSFSRTLSNMAKEAAIIEENEILVKTYRGQEMIDRLKHLGKTSYNGYFRLLEYEADRVREELKYKSNASQSKQL